MSKDFMLTLLVQGGLIGIFVMMAYHIGLSTGGAALASTMAFATLTLARLFHGFNCRADASIFKLGLKSNKYSLMAFAAGLILLNAVLFIPAFHGLFMIADLSFGKCRRNLSAGIYPNRADPAVQTDQRAQGIIILHRPSRQQALAVCFVGREILQIEQQKVIIKR